MTDRIRSGRWAGYNPADFRASSGERDDEDDDFVYKPTSTIPQVLNTIVEEITDETQEAELWNGDIPIKVEIGGRIRTVELLKTAESGISIFNTIDTPEVKLIVVPIDEGINKAVVITEKTCEQIISGVIPYQFPLPIDVINRGAAEA